MVWIPKEPKYKPKPPNPYNTPTNTPTDALTQDISKEDFATLCICAIRYCHGRKTYMPSLVMEIVGKHLAELSDRDIKVMYDDCRFMNLSDYGDEVIDKPDWLRWEKKLKKEMRRREDGEA